MLSKLLGKLIHDRRHDLTEVMASVYGPCPLCGTSSADHSVWEFASARPSDPNSQIVALEEAIARRDWKSASGIQEFRGTDDAIVFLLLRCPQDDGIALLRLESFFDLALDDRVVERQVLTAEEVKTVEGAAGLAWRKVGERGRSPDV